MRFYILNTVFVGYRSQRCFRGEVQEWPQVQTTKKPAVAGFILHPRRAPNKSTAQPHPTPATTWSRICLDCSVRSVSDPPGARTSTDIARWEVIAAEDKLHCRIEVLERLNERVASAIGAG
jgi:hypothetical protein